MTRAIEDELATAMRDQVAGLTPAPDLVARAVRRHRRHARIRLGASVTAAAGITAMVVAIGLPGASTRASRPLPSSPRARLLAAMTRSAQLSYRVHLVNLAVLPGHQMTRTSRPRDLVDWYADYAGVYDPRTRSGSGVNILRYESGGLGDSSTYAKPGGYDQVRVIGNRYYTRFSATTSCSRPGAAGRRARAPSRRPWT
jgi:hypothetical protein